MWLFISKHLHNFFSEPHAAFLHTQICASNICKVGRSASEEVVLHLIKTKCLPVLLYGLEVCSLTKADQRSLDFAVIRFLMKLFCTSNMIIINACLSYFDFRLLRELLLKRYEKYLVKTGLS